MTLTDFYQGRKVLVTGHTGFKGAWLSLILSDMGADVVGYSLEPPTDPNLFQLANIQDKITSIIGDVCDFDHIYETINTHKPELIFHLAAQPLVLDGYKYPRETYETNVMGTVNLLESVRRVGGVKSLLNITTDKVYLNPDDSNKAFIEDDPLDGFDPYSNSKSCSELVTHSYAKSFLTDAGCAVSTARAGNVIGGGDFSDNRIIPDCVRALQSGKPLKIRNANSTRPYQHVLEPLFSYLTIVKEQYENPTLAGSYNIGPNEKDCVTTGELVELFASYCEPHEFAWIDASDPNAPHEAAFLKLDSSKFKKVFSWEPRWTIREAVGKTVEWSKAYLSSKDILEIMRKQISEYEGC